jgi:hypothetical protein
MAKALATSVVATVNDDVDFGLRMFPSADAATGCDVDDQPEVPPAPATELTIIRELLSNLPLGNTPLADALDKVAADPGRLADKGVSGALIVVSDGGDSTSCQVDQPTAVTRLGAAAATLLKAGVKTYVIRFGTSDDATPEDAEILRAIVTNGGTAIVDPKNPDAAPYLDAPDETALNSVLNGISQALAECNFTIGDLKDDVDKSKVNLYLNGEAIPFDAKDQKKNGWGWANKAKTDIQMYGAACTDFKNNRITNLVVEFGCEVIPLR